MTDTNPVALEKSNPGGCNRRGFLSAVGAGAGAIAGVSLFGQASAAKSKNGKEDGELLDEGPMGPPPSFFSMTERDFRWARVRKKMKELGLDCLVAPSPGGGDMGRYASYLADGGFFMHSGAVIMPLVGEPALFGQLPRGKRGWIQDVAPKWEPMGEQLAAKLQAMGMSEARIGVVGTQSSVTGLNEFNNEGLVSYAVWSTVLAALPEADFVDVTPQMAELMAVRSAEEHEAMKVAADVSERLHRMMIDAAKPGTTNKQFRIAIAKHLINNGARADVQMLEMKPGPIADGDVINSEYGVWVGGGYVQATLCIGVGKMSRRIEDLARVAHEVFDVGAESLKPGTTFGHVVAKMQKVIQQSGCWNSIPVLHNLGNMFMVAPVANFPPPFVPSSTIGAEVEIQPGMTFSFECGARSGRREQVRVGGTAIVTDAGLRFLNTLGQRMQRVS